MAQRSHKLTWQGHARLRHRATVAIQARERVGAYGDGDAAFDHMADGCIWMPKDAGSGT
jgi:hypothetical protein